MTERGWAGCENRTRFSALVGAPCCREIIRRKMTFATIIAAAAECREVIYYYVRIYNTFSAVNSRRLRTRQGTFFTTRNNSCVDRRAIENDGSYSFFFFFCHYYRRRYYNNIHVCVRVCCGRPPVRNTRAAIKRRTRRPGRRGVLLRYIKNITRIL